MARRLTKSAVPVRKGRPALYPELGVTGLKQWGGWVREEFLTQLQGQRGMKTYREMRDNSAVVGACLGAIEMLIRQIRWWVEPASSDQEDLAVAAFVDQCRSDMSHTWEDLLSEILSFFTFGFSYHELVYKRRGGDSNDPKLRSKFSDGRIGWRKIPIRAQETVQRWMIDAEGGIQGMVQVGPPNYTTTLIPIEKALLFRAKTEKNNPEGRSILRNAYFSWYFSKKLSEIEGIGVARDLTGMPIMWIPVECFMSDATADQKATKAMAETIVKSIARDEQEGLVLPIAFDEKTPPQPKFKFELMSSPGRRQHDTDTIINRYDRRIAMSIMFDLVMMGQPNTLQYKGKNVPEFFAVSLDGWADSIAAVFNANGLPRLLRLNGIPPERAPKLKHGEIVTPDLAALGDYIMKLSGVGMPLFDDDWNFMRRVAGMRDAPKGQTPTPRPGQAAPAAEPLVEEPDGPEEPGTPDNEGGGEDDPAATLGGVAARRKRAQLFVPHEYGNLLEFATEQVAAGVRREEKLAARLVELEKRLESTAAAPAPDPAATLEVVAASTGAAVAASTGAIAGAVGAGFEAVADVVRKGQSATNAAVARVGEVVGDAIRNAPATKVTVKGAAAPDLSGVLADLGERMGQAVEGVGKAMGAALEGTPAPITHVTVQPAPVVMPSELNVKITDHPDTIQEIRRDDSTAKRMTKTVTRPVRPSKG